MQAILTINIVIGDRSYRIKIEPKDEEPVRKAVKVINDKIIDYKTQFSGKDMQDYVAMVLVWFATIQSEPGPDEPGTESIQSDLEAIEKVIDNVLVQK